MSVSWESGSSAERVWLTSPQSRAGGGTAEKRATASRWICSMRAMSSRLAARSFSCVTAVPLQSLGLLHRRLAVAGYGSQAEELPVQAEVAAQLGVKGESHHRAMADGHRASFVAGKDLRGAGVVHHRGPDEDAREGPSLQSADLQLGFEAIQLAPIAVAPHCDVQGVQTLLLGQAVVDAIGEKDHAGARSQRRQAAGDSLAHSLEQTHP